VTTYQVDDGKSAHTERHTFLDPGTLIIRATMRDDPAHPVQYLSALLPITSKTRVE
jgi:hypothetical protein